MSKKCVICAKEACSYRCPTCRVSYCSKDCCQKHKLECSIKEIKSADGKSGEKSVNIIQVPSSSANDGNSLYLLNEGQKKRLREVNDVQQLLKSKRFRQHLDAVDTAEDRPKALKNMQMKNPEFHAAMDLLLKTIERAAS